MTPNQGWSAARESDPEILEKFRPDPALDDYERLYQLTCNPGVMDVLARRVLPREMNKVVQHLLQRVRWRFRATEAIDALQLIFELGARWTESTPEELREARRRILDTTDHNFECLIEILSTDDYRGARL